jgi:hypothetical protein
MHDPRLIQRQALILGTAMLMALGASACRAVGDIFKAGIWVGVVVVIALVAIVAGVARLARH